MTQDKLEEHIFSTYIGLRAGMVVIAFALPVILWAGARVFFDTGLQSSISAYYDTGMRDWFCGILFATGICLYLYKGFTDEENIVLNISGVLALGVAVFPYTWRPFGGSLTPHGVCAVLFFVGIASVCWRRAADTLVLINDETVKQGFARKYKMIAAALAVSPLAAVAVNALGGYDALIFWIEVIGIYIFAYYWWTKGSELKQTRALQLVIEKRPDAKPLFEAVK